MLLLYRDEEFEVFGLREVLVCLVSWWETPAESTERRLIRRLTDFECEIAN